MGDQLTARFAIAGPSAEVLADVLAREGLSPMACAAAPGLLDRETLRTVDVLVIACSERTLLTPAYRDAVARVAPRTPKVAILSDDGPDAAAHVAQLGWHGFARAASPGATIGEVIATVATGELAFPSSATLSLVRALARVAPIHSAQSQTLTPRQQQVVTLIAEGATDAEVAARLRISRSTARKHVQNARRRLHARTRGQLVAASREPAFEDAG